MNHHFLFERGIDVSHESIRQWGDLFGQAYSNPLQDAVLAGRRLHRSKLNRNYSAQKSS
jgi:hypothetical protein